MKFFSYALLVFFLSACAITARTKPVVDGCINWMPLYINQFGGRIDATPHSVLLSIDKALETKLLGLVPGGVDHQRHCWYRNIESGGITLYPRNWSGAGSSYRFELENGSWVFKEELISVIHVDM